MGFARYHLLLPALLLVAGPAHSLDLLHSYRQALTQDASYQASRAETAAAREGAPQALSQLLPNVSGNLTRTQNTTDSAVPGLLG